MTLLVSAWSQLMIFSTKNLNKLSSTTVFKTELNKTPFGQELCLNLAKAAKLSLLVLASVYMTGCMRHEKRDPKVLETIFTGDNADFDYGGARAEVEENNTNVQRTRGWQVPLYQVYTFYAKVSDTASRNSLRDFQFSILDEDGNEICTEDQDNPGGEPKCRYTANANSEVVWREKIPYDFFKANAEPVRIVRKIKGLGTRRGERTMVFELNPWQPSRKFGQVFQDRTFLLTDREARVYVDPGYRSASKFRATGEDDASELVLRVDRQVYETTDPILVRRGDKLESLADEYQTSNLVFSRYEPTEFIQRRNKAKINSSNYEPVNELMLGQNRVYVYREKNTNLPEIDGLKFDMTLLMKLGYRYFNQSTGNTVTDLTTGRFRVHAHMVLEPNDGGQPVLLTPGLRPLEGDIERNNDLQLDFKTIIPYYPSSGVIKLALKVYPQGINQLKPVDRLFTVGRFSEMVGRSGNLIEDEGSRGNSFNFDEYVGAAINGEKAFELGNVDVARDFQVGPLDIRFRTVEAGETAAQRTVIFRVQTDVFNEMASIREGDNVPFEIVSVHRDSNDPLNTSKWKFVRLTNGENPNDPARVRAGRITWFDTITHKYYQKEELVERDIFITKWKPGLNLQKQVQDWVVNANGEVPDDKTLPAGVQKLKIYLNPWDEKFGTFGMDARETPELFLKNVREREKIPTRFFIGDFGYETLRFRYKIDKDMNLNVKKTVLLNLTPRVLRYSSILEGINSVYNLRDGIYLMKTMIQKDYLDPAVRNEADLLNVPYRLAGENTTLPTQEFKEETQNDIILKNDGSMEYGEGRPITNRYNENGELNPGAHSIESTDESPFEYKDPRRKSAMSMVKKLVRVNSGRVISPVEFSVEDLRLMRIRQQFFVQMEPVNQLRLQLVNLVKERFEEIFQLKLGEKSPILEKMTPGEQAGLKHLIVRALDALAMSVTDDTTISKLEDLEAVIQDPKVQAAFSDLARAQFGGVKLDVRLQDILIDLKKENDEALKTLHLTEDMVKESEAKVAAELEKDRKEHEEDLQALEDIAKKNQEDAKRDVISERQCGTQKKTQVYLDPSTKQSVDTKDIDPATLALIPFETGVFGDDYLDKVSKFSPFEDSDRQFFASIKTQQTLNKILTNDFTLAPAFSMVSNLDLLVDQQSGISPRTFVGPMTFLYNTNRGSLRPTDNLDEAYCETDDCNSLNTSINSQYGEIQNFEYEKSPYHGSIAHFQNVTFNDEYVVDSKTGEKRLVREGLETMYNRAQASKPGNAYAEGLLTRFLDHYDMSYVSLTDKPIDRLICRDDTREGSHCYTKDTKTTVPLNTFIDEYSKTVNEIVNKDYQQGDKVEMKFQDMAFHPRANRDKIVDHKIKYDYSLPWGFVGSEFGKDMYRCNLGLPGLESVCNSGGSSSKEVAYTPPTKEELNSIIRYPFKGKDLVGSKAAEFDQNVYSKMCDLLVYGEIARKAKKLVQSEADAKELRRDLFEMSKRCQADVAHNGDSKETISPVIIERKFRIAETGRYYFLGGKSMNVQASQDVRVSTGIRVSRNFGARPLRTLTGIIEKGSSYISRTIGLLSGSLDFSYSVQRDRGYYEGTGINEGTYLVMQNAEFEIELTNYEQCLSVRWSPDYVEKYSKIINFNTGKFSDFYITGLYLCSGVQETTPIAVNEKYYYFTQHFTEGDMLDPADIHNHPWLLSMRGVREFVGFMLVLKSWKKDFNDQSPQPEFASGEDMIDYFGFIASDLDGVRKIKAGEERETEHYKVTNRHDWPINQMVNTYKRVMPTFPGVYTQLTNQGDETDYEDRSWPWTSGEPGDIMQGSTSCSQLQRKAPARGVL